MKEEAKPISPSGLADAEFLAERLDHDLLALAESARVWRRALKRVVSAATLYAAAMSILRGALEDELGNTEEYALSGTIDDDVVTLDPPPDRKVVRFPHPDDPPSLAAACEAALESRQGLLAAFREIREFPDFEADPGRDHREKCLYEIMGAWEPE